jgi:hypothetical protein
MKIQRIRLINTTSKTCKNKMLLSEKHKCAVELRHKYHIFNLSGTNKRMFVLHTQFNDCTKYQIHGVV